MRVIADPTTATDAAPPPRPKARYIGIDLARFVAIIGMVAAHLVGIKAMLPNVSEFEKSVGESAELITNGTAAALFAVLGGLSMVFATRRLLQEGRVGAAIGAIMVRGGVLILIGMLLGILDSGIVVILAYYGVAMILVAPLIAVRGWILATIASVVGLLSGILNVHARRGLELIWEGKSVSFDLLFSDPVSAIRALFLTGEYPAITWSVYLIVGVLIARAFVTATRRGTLGLTAAKFAGVGVALLIVMQIISNYVVTHLIDLGVVPSGGSDIDQSAVAQAVMHWNYGAPSGVHPWVQVVAVPHSGSIGDLLRTIGIAFAVIGLLVWLCDRESVAGRKLGPVVGTIRATGAAPLTIYTLHILVSGFLLLPYELNPELWSTEVPWWIVGLGAFALQIAGALAIGAILYTTGRRGPLETLLSKIVSLCVRTPAPSAKVEPALAAGPVPAPADTSTPTA